MKPEQTERYSRHLLLKEVGGQGQQKLLAAKVLVIGAGGIGAPILQYLAGAGIGTIGIADDDTVSLSNLQRQVIFETKDLGTVKTTSAKAAINRLNPGVKVIEHIDKITRENASHIIATYDLVVEGIDNFAGRFVLNASCIAQNKPLVSAAIGRFDGQLSVFKPYKSPGVLPCYRCLVPSEPPRNSQINCAEEGVLGTVAGVVGTLAAMEVIKEILGIGESLAGHLLIYDGLNADFRKVKLPADPACTDCNHLSDM